MSASASAWETDVAPSEKSAPVSSPSHTKPVMTGLPKKTIAFMGAAFTGVAWTGLLDGILIEQRDETLSASHVAAILFAQCSEECLFFDMDTP